MLNTHQSNVTALPVRNALELYKEVASEITALEKRRKLLKAEIEGLMDRSMSDEIEFNGFKAKRILVVSERLDPAKAKEILGDRVQDCLVEVESVRLTVL